MGLAQEHFATLPPMLAATGELGRGAEIFLSRVRFASPQAIAFGDDFEAPREPAPRAAFHGHKRLLQILALPLKQCMISAVTLTIGN